MISQLINSTFIVDKKIAHLYGQIIHIYEEDEVLNLTYEEHIIIIKLKKENNKIAH